MRLKASEAGVWPPGVVWSVGKVRELELPADAELPVWLSEVKQPKAKAKAKAKGKAKPAPGASDSEG